MSEVHLFRLYLTLAKEDIARAEASLSSATDPVHRSHYRTTIKRINERLIDRVDKALVRILGPVE